MQTVCSLLFALLFLAASDGRREAISASTENPADSVLKKMAGQLKRLENIRYDLKRELNYPSEHYHNETTWNSFIDFYNADSLLGFRYQVEDEAFKQVYNGTEKFGLDKKEKTYKLDIRPDLESFNSLSFFYNSIITLRNALPRIIADKTITKTLEDTTVQQTSCSLVTLFLQKRRLRNLGRGYDAMTTKSNFIYKIIVDKKSSLPLEVIQLNDVNDDFIKTSFNNIQTNGPEPSELSWYYSSYTLEYALARKMDQPTLVAVGTGAPDWILPVYNRKANLDLKSLRGKLVLLDFWIRNCGPCIASIPDLNALQQKFNKKQFEIIGINAYDAKEEISWFCKKHQPDYTILMQGKAVAEQYGVSGYPTLVLLDRTGKILYAGTMPERGEMEKMIKKAM